MKTRFSFLMTAAIGILTTALPGQSVMAQTTRSSSSSSYSSSSSTGPGGTSYSSSSNSITLKDTPLLEALATVSRTTNTAIFVSNAAADALHASSQKVTVSEQNLSPEKLFAKMLAGTHLIALPIGSNVCILTEKDSVEQLKANIAEAVKAKTEQVKGLIPLSVIHMNHALRKPVTLTMVQTPAPFVIQMLEGMSQVKIQVPPEHQDQFFVRQPSVSVNAQGEPLGKVLESVAKQMGCELDVSQGAIAIRRPTATAK